MPPPPPSLAFGPFPPARTTPPTASLSPDLPPPHVRPCPRRPVHGVRLGLHAPPPQVLPQTPRRAPGEEERTKLTPLIAAPLHSLRPPPPRPVRLRPCPLPRGPPGLPPALPPRGPRRRRARVRPRARRHRGGGAPVLRALVSRRQRRARRARVGRGARGVRRARGGGPGVGARPPGGVPGAPPESTRPPPCRRRNCTAWSSKQRLLHPEAALQLPRTDPLTPLRRSTGRGRRRTWRAAAGFSGGSTATRRRGRGRRNDGLPLLLLVLLAHRPAPGKGRFPEEQTQFPAAGAGSGQQVTHRVRSRSRRRHRRRRGILCGACRRRSSRGLRRHGRRPRHPAAAGEARHPVVRRWGGG